MLSNESKNVPIRPFAPKLPILDLASLPGPIRLHGRTVLLKIGNTRAGPRCDRRPCGDRCIEFQLVFASNDVQQIEAGRLPTGLVPWVNYTADLTGAPSGRVIIWQENIMFGEISDINGIDVDMVRALSYLQIAVWVVFASLFAQKHYIFPSPVRMSWRKEHGITRRQGACGYGSCRWLSTGSVCSPSRHGDKTCTVRRRRLGPLFTDSPFFSQLQFPLVLCNIDTCNGFPCTESPDTLNVTCECSAGYVGMQVAVALDQTCRIILPNIEASGKNTPYQRCCHLLKQKKKKVHPPCSSTLLYRRSQALYYCR
jgi:hypothetical protein